MNQLLRSLITNNPAPAPPVTTTDTQGYALPSHARKPSSQSSRSSEHADPLAALRSIKNQNHEILDDDIRMIGGQTLDELIESSYQATSQASRASSQAGTASATFVPAPAALPAARPSAPPTPVALGGPISAANISKLHQICQKRAVTPVFTFEQVGIRHRCTLTIGDSQLVDDSGKTFGTKKEAKEAIAARGVDLVQAWIAEEERDRLNGVAGIIDAQRDGEKDAVENGQAKVKPAEENWVGILLEHAIAHKQAEPIYQPYQLGLHTFASTVTISTRPDTPFGSSTTAHASKKGAKAAAAREAVIWLRSEGHLGAAGTPPPRKKAKLSHDTSPSDPLLAQAANSSSSTSTFTTPHPPSHAPSAPLPDLTTVPQTATFAHQVHVLANLLGLQQPQYRFTPALDTALYTGAAYFPDQAAGGALAGPLGWVSNVFGKRAAREECARVVVGALRQEVERRRRVGGWHGDGGQW